LSTIDNLTSFQGKSTTKITSAKGKFDVTTDVTALPANNFMISMLKYKCLLVLMELLNDRDPSSYVYYLLRRVIEPDVFRKNFAYQEYFIKKFHKSTYSLKMFFRYNNNVDSITGSPLIIEVGYLLYFMLMKMRPNLVGEMDEKYYNRLVKLLSNKDKMPSVGGKNMVLSIIDFTNDIGRLISGVFKKKENIIVIEKVNEIAKSDIEMRQILRVYAQNVSKIEIFKEGEAQIKYFPLLPY
jgi:hypothetical protein